MGNIILGELNILVAFIGILLIILTIYEYRQLSKLREDFKNYKKEIQQEMYRTQKAIQRVIASYHIADVDRKIELLKSAIKLNPGVFNAYNALGYAYLEKKMIYKAIDAFKDAIHFHPDEKEGYFDLAYAYLKAGDKDLALHYLKQAIEVDPSSREDLKDNPLFEEIKEEIKRII